MNKFTDVALPIPLKTLTYRIPSIYKNRVHIGSGVLVPLRKGKLLLAIVVRLHSVTPLYETQDLLAVIYPEPLFTPPQLKFMEWIADYYLSNLGATLSVALPKVLASPHNIIFQINHPTPKHLEAKVEQLIETALQRQPLSYQAITHIVGPKEASKALISLLSKKLIKAVAATDAIRIGREKIYSTTNTYSNLLPSQIAMPSTRSPKQQALLSYFLPNPSQSIEKIYASKKKLLDLGYSTSALNALLKKEILTQADSSKLQSPTFTTPLKPLVVLTNAQKQALLDIQEQFTKKEVVLLHGAIGSGKTELYMHLMQVALLQQKQVLLLLPEIGLVTHMVERIKPFLGEWLVVYHSKQSNKERLTAWSRVVNQQTLVVIGARSALFLPFNHLQLIIIDEEHDSAYKQTDRAPTYHARDSSILLAQQHQAKVLLGSGTPSIETYYNSQSDKYGLVALQHKFGAADSPKLFFIDLNLEKKRKAMRENFSFTLLSMLKKTMMEKGQAMIFQNRRGYARHLICESCGWVPRCLACAVSLTYHQEANHLLCHYCGYTAPPFKACTSCGSGQLHNIGFGTEKVEETLQLIFPQQKIGRMDLDSTKGKNAYQSILKQVTAGLIDILVGTQMIAKGLDFANIRLVGVLDIDGLLYFPDFRSNEKCFQLITQLAGRSGRRNHQGNVFIQTTQPHHPLFQHLSDSHYQSMYTSELAEREQFLYPPYVKLIKLTLSCIEQATLKSGARELKKVLTKQFGEMVLGPQQPLVGKIRNCYLLDIFLKLLSKNMCKLQMEKERVKLICNQLLDKGPYKKIKILFDIDPI